jgi:pimeloyl-ACP methyl ester carboxylesterase
MMPKVTSKDSTQIAYEKTGAGPAVILVDGALCYRAFGPMQGLAKLLSPHFTVTTYDRRGRGESGDTQPYALEREIEDLEALIQAALEAAAQLGDRIKKLAIYEAPYNAEESALQAWREYRQQLNQSLAAGRRGEAVVAFMKLVGTPAEQIEGMRQAPVWPMFEAVAPTLAYDAAALGEDRLPPTQLAARVRTPALVMNGTAIPFMCDTAQAIAEAMPNGQQRTLEGQTHEVDPEVLAPVLMEFFAK